jgi:hypothetical protein
MTNQSTTSVAETTNEKEEIPEPVPMQYSTVHYSSVSLVQEENCIVLFHAISAYMLVHCTITVFETERPTYQLCVSVS